MPNRIKSGALSGIEGLAVTVETDICRGLPGFHIVGLPGAEVRESRERVLAALRNSGFRIPLGKITVNLAPAGIRKEGASFDLAIAMGVMMAAGGGDQAPGPRRRAGALFLGELSLFGEVRPVRGLLSIVLGAAERGEQRVVVPSDQVWEAKLAEGIEAVGVATLTEAVAWWRTGRGGRVEGATARPVERDCGIDDAGGTQSAGGERVGGLLAGMEGQRQARKAAVLAAVGGHNLLLVGPPGTGKTRLARILGRLQPDLDRRRALEVTRIHGAAGTLRRGGLIVRPPFRAPHHTITRAGLIGGGSALRPGEVTLAHRGVLFLDEIAEFPPAVLDVLREPLEEGWISVVRGPGGRRFPARFQLVAAMNPCRCGYRGSGVRECRCRPADRRRYLSRLSGPLLDRFDLFVEMGPWEGSFLTGNGPAGRSAGAMIRDDGRAGRLSWRDNPSDDLLDRARERLRARAAAGHPAGRDTSARDLDAEATEFLERARKPLGLSLRAVGRCLAVARTIAALDDRDGVSRFQIQEALEFRRIPFDG